MELSIKTTEKQIREVYDKFISAIEKDDFAELNEIMLPDAYVNFSTLGEFNGIKEVSEGLKWRGSKFNVSRYQTFNFAALSSEKEARHSSCLIALLAEDDGKKFDSLQFGGHFATKLKFIDGTWKFSEIRFELAWDYGDKAIANHWHLIDYRLGWFPDTQNPVIVSELDTPWRIIKESDIQLSEEDKVKHTFYKYAWGADMSDFELCAQTLADDLVTNFAQFVPMDKRDILSFVRKLRAGESNWQHACRIVSVDIDGDKANMKMFRSEPHRIAPVEVNRDNYKSNYYTARYETVLRKSGGDWRFERIDYYPGVFLDEE